MNEFTCPCRRTLPILPVARAIWKKKPNLETAANAWIQAGGRTIRPSARRSAQEYIEDLAEMVGIECVVIDGKTDLRAFRHELRWNEVAFKS